MENWLYLLAAFYLIGVPILVIVALVKSSGTRRDYEYLEGLVRELQEELKELRLKHRERPAERRDAPVAAAVAEVARPVREPEKPVTMPPPLPTPAMAAVQTPPVGAVAPQPVVREPEAPFKVPPVPVESPLRAPALPPKYAFRPPPPRPAETRAETSRPIREKDPQLEIKLGAWWATRLGISFLVVAVVFFGVYVSVHATPWVRLLEVLAVAAGLAGAGRWLERSTPIYGRVLFAGGLALFYFAAYGAYAVPTIKVVANLGVGLALQFGAVLALTAVALRRNRQGLAMMAVFTGTLSCFFALSNHQLEVTLVAALGLAVVGAGLRVMKGWAWPLALGYAGAQACYLAAVLVATGNALDFMAVAERLHNMSRETWPGFTLVFPTAFFAVMAGADLLAQRTGRKGAERAREMTIRVAAVAYGLGAWWGGAAMGGEWAKWNMLTAAGACFALGFIYQRRKDLPALYEMLLAAAGAWVAVYLILEYAGWVRWSALLAEAYVFAGWARRREAFMAVAGLMAAWALSGAWALWGAVHVDPGASMWAAQRLVVLGWALASVGLWAWWGRSPRGLAHWEFGMQNFGRLGTAAGIVLLGSIAWIEPTQPRLFLGLAVVATALGWVLKDRGGVATAVAAWAASGVWAVVVAWHMYDQVSPWAVERLVFFGWPLVSVGLWAWWSRRPEDLEAGAFPLSRIGRVATAVVTVVIGALAWTGGAQPWLFMGLTVPAAALGWVLKERSGAMTAGAALLAALVTFGQFDGADPGEIWLRLGLLTLLVLAATGWAQRTVNEEKRDWATAGETVYLLGLLWAWWQGLAGFGLVGEGYWSLVLTAAAGGLVALAWRGPWRAAGDVAWLWGMVALACAFGFEHKPGMDPWTLQMKQMPNGWPVVASDTPWACLGLTLALAWAWGKLARREKPGVALLRLNTGGNFLPAILLIGWTLGVMPAAWTETYRMLAMSAAALVYLGVGRREWLPSGMATGVFFAAAAWWKAVNVVPVSANACGVQAVVAVALLFLGWLGVRRHAGRQSGEWAVLTGMVAVAALAAMDVPASRLPADLAHNWMTLLWAAAGGMVFASGLAGRLRSYRYAGLGGLALCLPRLFMVDITDTLGRIFAFGALAVVLLAIGFSYEKLKAWLAGNEESI